MSSSSKKEQTKLVVKTEDVKKIDSIIKIQQLTEKEGVQDYFHGIHNYMRNNGIGYGMSGLKVFSLFFGLMSIEQKPKCLKLLNFDKKFTFSNIVKLCEDKKYDIHTFINVELLDYLADKDNNCRDLFFFEISNKITGNVLRDFILNKIKPLEKYIKSNANSNIQLNGKIYEYFIGRDKDNIKEFGAYFTDRYITLYISLKSPLEVQKDGIIPYNIDMFGGSGGFTITNIEQLINDAKDKGITINWKKEIKKIYHFDMNPDVVKHAAFETFLLLEQIPGYDETFKWSNSFKEDETIFKDLLKQKYIEVRTNPPYGGDSFDKQVGQIAQFIKMVNFIKENISGVLDELFKEFDIAKYKLTLNEKVLKSKKYTDKGEFNKLFNTKFNNIIKKQYNDIITNAELQTYIGTEIKPYFKLDIEEDELNTQLIKFTKLSEKKFMYDLQIKQLEDKHKKEDIVSLHSSSKIIKEYNKLIKNYDFNKITTIEEYDFTTNDKTYNPNIDNYRKPKFDGPYDKEAVSLILLMATIQNGGRCVGVLKEGVFFNDTYRYLRAYLCCNFEVEYITSIDQKAFENTATKTSIICFKNTGKPTTSIKFYDLLVVKQEEDEIEFDEEYFPIVKRNKGDIINFENNDINEMEQFVSEASFEELVKNEFNLQGKTYEKKLELIPGDDFKMVKLEDICEFGRGKDTKSINNSKYYIIGGGGYNNKKIAKMTNNYNLNENNLLISRVGNPGLATINTTKIWCSDKCFYVSKYKLSNINNIYLKIVINIYKSNNNIGDGSIIGCINLQNLKKIQIPIPKTDELMDYWTEKISTPFDKMNEKEEKIKSLEQEIENEVKRIIDEEECIDTKLGDICELLYGSSLTKEQYIKGNYPVIGGGITYIDFHNTYNNLDSKLTISKDGNSTGFVKLHNSKFFATSHAIIIYKLKLNLYYLYSLLTLNYNKLNKLDISSTRPSLKINSLKKFEIPIPKNPDILKSLNPKIKKLEKVRLNFEKYKTQYEEALQELKTTSIKGGLN
jgi:restriction endonuclease S subunit